MRVSMAIHPQEHAQTALVAARSMVRCRSIYPLLTWPTLIRLYLWDASRSSISPMPAALARYPQSQLNTTLLFRAPLHLLSKLIHTACAPAVIAASSEAVAGGSNDEDHL
jgi:hypothetical protein